MVHCSNFKGCCTYPLGGYGSFALILCTCCAFGSTLYAAVGCEFASLTFTSDYGSFEEYFVESDLQNERVTYRTSIGLFQWLRPNDLNDVVTEIDWKKNGACVGFQQTMLTQLTKNNPFFDLSRVFAIITVLMSILLLGWSFMTSCVLWNKLQLFLLSCLYFMSTIFCGLTFLLYKSNVCTSLFVERRCRLDNGALVMIGAAMLWFVSFLISVAFLSPVDEFNTARRSKSSKPATLNREQKDAMARNEARERTIQQQRKGNGTNTNNQVKKNTTSSTDASAVHDAILSRNSYSFDSQENWHKPIPSRQQNTLDIVSAAPQQLEPIPEREQPQQNKTKSTTTRSNKEVSSMPESSNVTTLESNSMEPSSLSLSPFLLSWGKNTNKTENQTNPKIIANNKSKSSMIIDDASTNDTMEVYIQRKLDKIEQLMTNEV